MTKSELIELMGKCDEAKASQDIRVTEEDREEAWFQFESIANPIVVKSLCETALRLQEALEYYAEGCIEKCEACDNSCAKEALKKWGLE